MLPLDAFSKTLAEVYETAEHAAPDKFPAEMLRAVRQLIRFDGVLLGSGTVDVIVRHYRAVQPAHEHGEGGVQLQDDKESAESDPTVAMAIEGLTQTLTCDCENPQIEQAHPWLRKLTAKYGCKKILLHGSFPAWDSPHPRWLLLYRSDPEFNDAEVAVLHALWRHLTRASAMNLKHALDDIDPHRMTRALALINSRGTIEIANQALRDLLRLEWPNFSEQNLPPGAMAALLNAGRYRGKRIEISASYRFGYMACMARRVPLLDTLAPSERNVADRFAKGMTHTEIASHLSVSPHTVRNQLAQVYQKLGIHSKADLVRIMSSRQRQ
jgi:DNA-binding NarL/FixJ family response regulator